MLCTHLCMHACVRARAVTEIEIVIPLGFLMERG